MDYQKKLAELMVLAAQQGASDLHLSVGKHPTVRIDGNLVPISNEPILTPELTAGLIGALLNEEQQETLITEKEIDFAFSYENKIRFRINVYFQKGYLSAALRLIPAQIRTIEELGLPTLLHEFCTTQQGFVLIVGPAGHGKTTTLAALIDEINHKRMEHIITVEDPIEYTFTQDRALIDQREVGSDTISFHRALRSVLRQDPDVIMVGEMRDPDSISIALTAAETGHLVFSTLHTNSASQTIDRIVDSFPGAQQGQIRSQLATTLVGIVSERLVPKISGGRVPVCEIMFANSAIKNLIREKKTYQIDLVIETSIQDGMMSLNRSLVELVRKREISLESAENYSLNPSELRQLLG
ncbi:MAG: type IV pilus twitching motility protein PilT [Candidatus Pacebacteria bacterium]|jgi:twitching motility protein PilT|nr:type IV pilus twitching motility protein PilT [Candidatus Paceibacterota bacterium]